MDLIARGREPPFTLLELAGHAPQVLISGQQPTIPLLDFPDQSAQILLRGSCS